MTDEKLLEQIGSRADVGEPIDLHDRLCLARGVLSLLAEVRRLRGERDALKRACVEYFSRSKVVAWLRDAGLAELADDLTANAHPLSIAAGAHRKGEP